MYTTIILYVHCAVNVGNDMTFTFNIVPILISILQVYIPPSGPVPGTAGLEEAEGVHESGAGGAQHEVVLIDVEAARDRQVQ